MSLAMPILYKLILIVILNQVYCKKQQIEVFKPCTEWQRVFCFGSYSGPSADFSNESGCLHKETCFFLIHAARSGEYSSNSTPITWSLIFVSDYAKTKQLATLELTPFHANDNRNPKFLSKGDLIFSANEYEDDYEYDNVSCECKIFKLSHDEHYNYYERKDLIEASDSEMGRVNAKVISEKGLKFKVKQSTYYKCDFQSNLQINRIWGENNDSPIRKTVHMSIAMVHRTRYKNQTGGTGFFGSYEVWNIRPKDYTTTTKRIRTSRITTPLPIITATTTVGTTNSFKTNSNIYSSFEFFIFVFVSFIRLFRLKYFSIFV